MASKLRWAAMTTRERRELLTPAITATRHASKPNKAELRLLAIVGDLGFPRFMGDGEARIGSKFPDFVHEELPIIVEMFGDYWHRGDSGKVRRAYFARRGYRMVIVREHELRHPETIRRRVRRALS
jgi:very-short-patch-repair endonuclease